MWDIIYTTAEKNFLNAFTEEEMAFYTTLLFSFKESFYKMQHPVTKTFLEFTDVEVCLHESVFEIKVVKEFDGRNKLPQAMPLHFSQQNDQVITFCYLTNIVTNI